MTLINIKTKHIGSMFITDSYQMFQKLCKPLVCTQKKKRQISNGISKYFIRQSIYELCYNSPRKKAKLKQPAYRSNEFQFIQLGVCEFIFPSKFKRGSMFCDSRRQTSLKHHETFKEFTPPVIIFLTRNCATDIVNPMYRTCISCMTSSQ